MSNKNNFDFFPEEDRQQDASLLPDISDEIGADVAAILADELNDPSQEIGADVEAIMAADFSDADEEIGADIEAIMSAGLVDPSETIRVDTGVILHDETPAFEPAFMDGPVEEAAEEWLVAPAEAPLPENQVYTMHISEKIVAETQQQYDDCVSSLLEAAAVPVETEAPVATPELMKEAVFFEEEAAPFNIPPEENISEAITGNDTPPISNQATQIVDTEDPLYHALLADPVVGNEINADEHAAYSVGLIHPDEADIERIIGASTEENLDFESTQGISTVNLESPEMPLDVQAITDDPVIQDYVDPNHPLDASAEEVSELIEEEPHLPKRRPKMKRGYGLFGLPHVLSTVIWLAIVIAIGVSLGRMIWVCTAEVLAFGKPDKEYTITITDADNIETVASKLKNAGLIKYPELFKWYAGITEAEEELSAGTFTLNSKYDYNALVKAMTFHSTARATVNVIIPEGYTCAQIFALLEEKGVCPASELEEYAANGEIKERWFLEGIDRGDKYCLEGYLFPDTYEFYTDDEPGRVLGKFLDNFDNRFTTIMKDKIDPLNQRMAEVLASRGYSQEYIDDHKFTIRDIVIIASMIERETANDAESYDISSVIYNRLTNPKEYLYLNIDATIIYALGGNIDPVTGKTKPLTKEDLQLDSPYNTYTNPGMIPGPISNPGSNSLNAALDPNVTNYYFYVYNPNTGKHMFAKTAAEHDKNVAYVRSLENDNE